ncbi:MULTISPECIES: type III secretion system translocon subunit SctE [unclassified Achromobacter]|uniref:type III secretion system translocon subunit SctE n=1 Tax=unclassified Achromobacter TaxID=2626865 RepID=UPI000B51621C|nr:MULTISPECIES: type III secretion system translocon subunit SctE [unclassified Achromobacter]OWT72713.1 hypothetical protein CEY05_22650 [Achromobacter sp. HZ34]OWT73932.1 hypothetical protein CEY04_21475 [Achromobacter sp. HZ28]
MLGVPGVNMPLIGAAQSSLNGLAGEDTQDFPSLQEQAPLSNGNGAPSLPGRYTSAEEARWATMDIMAMLPAIDLLIGTGFSQRMSDGSKSLKARLESNEAMRESSNLKRAEEHKKRAEAQNKSFWARIGSLISDVVTTVFLAVAVAASFVSGVGVVASPLLIAMLCASVVGIVEKTVQFAVDENFTFMSGFSSVAKAIIKWAGGSDEFAEKLGNAIGAALVIATVVGVINDPSAVGQLVSNELKLVGVPDEIADVVDQVMTIGATIGIMAFSFYGAKASASSMGGFSKLASNLKSGVNVKNFAVASDAGGQLLSAGTGAAVGVMNGTATWDSRDADKIAIQAQILQAELKASDRYGSVESDTLKRSAASFNVWREAYVTMLGGHGDMLRRLTGSVFGDVPVGA